MKSPEDLARSVSQLFLGVRIECAQCHHHPFEKWAQEDYFALAEATGLRSTTIFFRYAVRNAFLPQYTALGLSMAFAVSGQVVVEVVFAYPGMGTLLFRAIQASDYTVINGVVLITIMAIGLVTMVMDFTYPLLDPRISHQRWD